MMRRFSLAVEQVESDVTDIPFPHLITEFRKKDHRDLLSSDYDSQKYLPGELAPFGRGWLGKYIEAGPTSYEKYMPRVYNTGTLGLHLAPHRKSHDDDMLRFEVLQFECAFPSTTSHESVYNIHLNTACRLATMHAPTFRASATVRLLMEPLQDSNRHWSIGWVQGCMAYHSYCRYENGGSMTYELPYYGIRTGQAHSQPWYQASAVLDLKDIAEKDIHQYHTVQMIADEESSTKAFPMGFYDGIEFCREPSSKANPPFVYMHWMQKYRAWLVLRENNSGSLFILRSVTWSNEVHYEPPNRRITYAESKADIDPRNFFIPQEALESDTLFQKMHAIYHLKAWGDLKYDQIEANRPSGTTFPRPLPAASASPEPGRRDRDPAAPPSASVQGSTAPAEPARRPLNPFEASSSTDKTDYGNKNACAPNTASAMPTRTVQGAVAATEPASRPLNPFETSSVIDRTDYGSKNPFSPQAATAKPARQPPNPFES